MLGRDPPEPADEPDPCPDRPRARAGPGADRRHGPAHRLWHIVAARHVGDKQIHALAFAMLVLPLGWVRPGWAAGLVAGALAYGGAIELIQPGIGRTGEWADLAANAMGCAIGLLPGQLRHRLRAARR